MNNWSKSSKYILNYNSCQKNGKQAALVICRLFICKFVYSQNLTNCRNSVFAVKCEESHHNNDHQQIKFPQKFDKEVVKWMKIFDRDLNRKKISKDFFSPKTFQNIISTQTP